MKKEDLQKPVKEIQITEDGGQAQGRSITPVQQNRELSLQEKVDEETKNRAIMTEYIKHHMKEGSDYGKIHMSKTCQNKYNCQISVHFSKASLFKPGAEKVGSLLKIRPDIVRDNDTWEMSGSKPGLFCYRCNLYSLSTGELVGMGLGACNIQEKYGNENNAIKCGKKRAFVDAILSTGSLSDMFTQDLEDMQEYSSGEKNGSSSPSYAPQKSLYQQARENPAEYQKALNEKKEEIPLINASQQVRIRQLEIQKGITLDDIEEKIAATVWKNGKAKTKLSELNEQEANSLIKTIEEKLPDKKKNSEVIGGIDLDMVDAAIDPEGKFDKS